MSFAVVTGAAHELGRQIAEALAAYGFQVLALDRETPQIEADSVENRAIDLRELDQVDALAAQLHCVDILVNASRFNAPTPIEQSWVASAAAFADIVDGNVLTTLLLTRALTPIIKQSGGGHIINVASHDVLPWDGTPTNLVDQDVFASSMWALNGFTDAWAKTLAKDNIKVNAICPEPQTPVAQTAQRILTIIASGRTGENFPDSAGATDLPPEPAPHQRITG